MLYIKTSLNADLVLRGSIEIAELLLFAYVCKWYGHAPTKSSALYGDDVHYVSFSNDLVREISRKANKWTQLT